MIAFQFMAEGLPELIFTSYVPLKGNVMSLSKQACLFFTMCSLSLSAVAGSGYVGLSTPVHVEHVAIIALGGCTPHKAGNMEIKILLTLL